MKVLIVGGGIAGLVLALKLERLGIESEIHEVTREMRPLSKLPDDPVSRIA